MLEVGQQVGHIRVTGLLGRGGMGAVFAGEDLKLRRPVALKAILGHIALDPGVKARFLREARVLSRLRHPNICAIHDYVERGDCDVLVLELVEGQALRERMRAGVRPPEALALSLELAQVLVAAHAEGIVHRDLKPANVMVTPTGSIKVLDFGLARNLDEEVAAGPAPASPPAAPAGEAAETSAGVAEEAAAGGAEAPTLASRDLPTSDPPGSFSVLHRTREGSLLGTPQYMSPEQARGEPATPASDMFAFGLIVQELFTGVAPHPPGIELAQVIQRAAQGQTEPARGARGDLLHLIERLKRTDPARRLTAAEARARLLWIAGRRRRWLRRGLLAAGIVAISLGAAKYTLDLRRERTQALAARERAEQARAAAEGLVEFMLDDLTRGLESVGRLDLLEQVARRALAHYEGVPWELLAEAGDRPARALQRVGVVLEDRADWEGALRAHRRALSALERWRATRPEDFDRNLSLIVARTRYGSALSAMGRFEQAQEVLARAARDAGSVAVPGDGERLRLAVALADLHSLRADTAWRRGDATLAASALEQGGAVVEQVRALEPDGRRWRNLLTSHLYQKVHVDREQGRFEAMLEDCLALVREDEALLALEPRSAESRAMLVKDLPWLAFARRKLGDARGARAELDRALALGQELVRLDGENSDWRNDLAMVWIRVGELGEAGGRTGEARAAFQRAEDLMAPIVTAASAPYMIDTRVLGLLKLGRREQARPLVEALLARGWGKGEFLELLHAHGLGPAAAN